jgi:hypothetical protein
MLMDKKLFPAAVALALLAPLATARAGTNNFGGNFCTSGLSLNFCGSVTVSATANSNGGTDVTFQVANTTSGSPMAVFTAVGINNAGFITSGATYSGLTVTQNGNSYSGWTIGSGPVGAFFVNALASTGEDLTNSISSACGPSTTRIDTCGAANPVTISFHTSDNFTDVSGASLYITAAVDNGTCVAGPGPGCAATTTTPEPATLALFATGLMGLAPAARWRRRRDS